MRYESLATWEALAIPTELCRIDLGVHTVASVETETRLDVEKAGVIDAILVSFAADLGSDIRLAPRPCRDETSSWDASVWFLPDGLQVEAGERLRVAYRFGVPGRADGLTCERDAAQA